MILQAIKENLLKFYELTNKKQRHPCRLARTARGGTKNSLSGYRALTTGKQCIVVPWKLPMQQSSCKSCPPHSIFETRLLT
jgi:hypothetical protein